VFGFLFESDHVFTFLVLGTLSHVTLGTGDMCLKIVDGGRFRDIPIREGECFLLPARVPHSPQRLPNTMGLVIERDRNEQEIDALRWYCPKCRRLQYQDTFHCVNLGMPFAIPSLLHPY
jgi:3-hydroxyanthranilate 3,4-dioxygenase